MVSQLTNHLCKLKIEVDQTHKTTSQEIRNKELHLSFSRMPELNEQRMFWYQKKEKKRIFDNEFEFLLTKLYCNVLSFKSYFF